MCEEIYDFHLHIKFDPLPQLRNLSEVLSVIGIIKIQVKLLQIMWDCVKPLVPGVH